MSFYDILNNYHNDPYGMSSDDSYEEYLNKSNVVEPYSDELNDETNNEDLIKEIEDKKTLNERGEVIIKMIDTDYNNNDLFDLSSLDNQDHTIYEKYIPENDMVDDSLIYYNCYRCWNPFSNLDISTSNKLCLNCTFHFMIIFLLVSSLSIILTLVYKSSFE